MGAEAGCPSPRAEVALDLQHAQLAIQKDGVDREPHEPRVDGPGAADHETVAFRQRLPAEQPARALPKTVRQVAALADDLAVASEENKLMHGRGGVSFHWS